METQDFWINAVTFERWGPAQKIQIPKKCPVCVSDIRVIKGGSPNYASTILDPCEHVSIYDKVWEMRLEQSPKQAAVVCGCGGEICRTTHSTWCPKFEAY